MRWHPTFRRHRPDTPVPTSFPWIIARHLVAEFDTMAVELLSDGHPVELGDNRAGHLQSP